VPETKPDPDNEASRRGEDDSNVNDDDRKAADEPASERNDSRSSPTSEQPTSLSIQSKIRSSSFRRTSISNNPLSPTAVSDLKSPTLPPLSPGGDTVTDIYRKQTRRIEELERENKRLEHEFAESQRRRIKAEREAEELRETTDELNVLKNKAEQVDAHAEETETLVRTPTVFTSTR
jgi:vacuolar-type H+-ATPase subunit I/STV1